MDIQALSTEQTIQIRHVVGQHHPSTTTLPALARILVTAKNTKGDVCK